MKFFRYAALSALFLAFPLSVQAAPTGATSNISPHGTSINLPQANGFGGNIIFQSYTNTNSARVTLSTQLGATPNLPPVISGVQPFHVNFSVDRDVDFSGLPDFALILPKSYPDYAYLIVLRDALTGKSLGVIDQYIWFDKRFFIGNGPWLARTQHSFHLTRQHPYVAEVIAAPGTMALAVFDGLEPQSTGLPTVGGYRSQINFPAMASGGGLLLLRTSATQNFQPLVAPGVPAWYLDGVMEGSVELDQPVTLDVELPANLPQNAGYRLKYYNQMQWGLGWQDVMKTASYPHNRIVHFEADLQNAVKVSRRFVLAVVPANAPLAANPVAALHNPIVVLSDSFASISIVPNSPTICSGSYKPWPSCQNTFDPEVIYPQLLAHKLHRPVLNFSVNGEAIDEVEPTDEPAMDVQVPQIPESTSVVIVGLGMNDIQKNPQTDYRKSFDELTSGILQRAPHAKIIYLGIRYFHHVFSDPKDRALRQDIDGINDYEKVLARRYGGFIDLRSMFPAEVNPEFPDGAHGVYSVHVKIADALAALIRGLAPKP